MIGAIGSFSLMAIAGRAALTELDTFEIMTYRSFVGIVLVVVIRGLAGTLSEVSTRDFGTHALRNMFHFAGQNLWFAGLTLIPLAQLFALEFTSPLWVLLLSPLFLGETFRTRTLLYALMGFVGILIVARPGAGLSIGVAFGLLAAIGFAGSIILTKKLTERHTITGILFWLTVMQAVFGLTFCWADGSMAWPSAATWPPLLAIGCAGLLAHFCLTTALSLAPASVVIPIDFARLPLIAIVGMVLYGEALDLWVFVGGALIFLANYLNILAATRQTATDL